MATAAASKPSATSSRHSLYCSNLPDKLQKDDLKRALYMLFSTYGPILDIVALKTTKMRGQAHVLFRDITASTQAMQGLQGHDFFGKQMKIAYANSKSDTLAKLDGTYRQPQPSTAVTTTTAGQQSVFAAPPGATAASTASTLSAPPAGNIPAATNGAAALAASPSPAPVLGKRGRGDEDEDEEAPMEVDDDAMEESDSD